MAKKRQPPKSSVGSSSRNLLGEAVAALHSNTPLMATRDEMAHLLTDPRGALVEFNENVKDGDKIAWRATHLGVQAQSGSAPATNGWGQQPARSAPVPASNPAPQAPQGQGGPSARSYSFDSGIPIPAARRGGPGNSVYGFEQMEVGKSFFIPASEDDPNPAKRIASTVSSASKRLNPKKFVVRSVDETDQGRSKGARVWRTD